MNSRIRILLVVSFVLGYCLDAGAQSEKYEDTFYGKNVPRILYDQKVGSLFEENPLDRSMQVSGTIRAEVESGRLDLENIYFALDEHDLDDTDQQILAMVAEKLKSEPNIRIQIQGHCDDQGPDDYNLELGERRAASVKNYLIDLGVDPERLGTISFGKDKPACEEMDEDCRQRNRRVHFTMFEAPQK